MDRHVLAASTASLCLPELQPAEMTPSANVRAVFNPDCCDYCLSTFHFYACLPQELPSKQIHPFGSPSEIGHAQGLDASLLNLEVSLWTVWTK